MDVVVVIADANTHVPVYIVRHGDGDRETKDCVGHAESIDVAVTAEDFAGNASGDQANNEQYRIGNMREAEESRTQQHGATRRN